MSHKCKEMERMICELAARGFRVEKSGNCVKLFPPDKTLPMLNVHLGERGLHPLRRCIKNVWKINLD